MSAFAAAQPVEANLCDPQHWTGKLFCRDWVPAHGETRDVIEPATGNVLDVVGMADAEDVAQAAAVAQAVQPAWANTSAADRAAILRRAAELLLDDQQQLSTRLARETGSILSKARFEIRHAAHLLHLAAAMALQPQGTVLSSSDEYLSYARRLPRGVVGVISPFNFPLALSTRAVAPALALGNAVVLKPDPRTPVAGGFMLVCALAAAGLPAGVLSVLPGAADAGEALCSDPRIAMVSFTGSTAAGRRVAQLAGAHLKKVSLELGGNNAIVVLDDADLDRTASNVAWAAWLHQGQICMSAGRVLVHRSIAAELGQRLVRKAAALKLGNPLDPTVQQGPLISEAQRDRVHGIVTDTIHAGAKLLYGGTYCERFYSPTVLGSVRPGTRAYDEEIFGPVVSLVEYSDDEQAVALANSTEYGLAAAVIGRSLGRARQLASKLKAGLIHVNDQTINDQGSNPFAGQGISGNGSALGGLCDMAEYSQWQWLTLRSEPLEYPF